MPRVRNRAVCRAGLTAMVVCLSGCADVPKPSDWIADVRPQRVQRATDASKSFDTQREQSEYQAAVTQFQQGDTKACRTILEGLLKRNPKHRDARLLLAESSLLEHQPAPAREQLQLALKECPNDPELLHTMGLAAEMEDQSDEAVDWFERAAKLAPDNGLYAMSFESAVEDRAAGAAVATDGEDGASSRRKTPAAAEATHASHESRDDWPNELDGGPRAQAGLPAAKDLIARGGAALAAGAVETARGYFDRASKAAPSDEGIRISAVVTALRHDELDLAAELAENGLEQFPESAGLYRVLGTARYRRGDLHAAKSSLERAVALDDSSGLAYFLLGSTLAKLGESKSAEWYLNQAQRLDPRFASRR